MQVPEAEGNFYDGFQFALLVVEMLPKFDGILAKLRTVASGEVTLMQSADDIRLLVPVQIAKLEKEQGRGLTNEEKELVRVAAEMAIPKNRAEQDARNQEFARIVLRTRRVQQDRMEETLKKRLGS